MSPREPPFVDLERMLRSRPRRLAAVAALVVLVALAASLQRREFLAAFGRGQDFAPLFVRQLGFWSAWALVGALAVRLAGAMMVRLRAWIVVLALQLPLSLAVAWAFAKLNGRMFSPFRGGSPAEFRPPGPRGFHAFRMEREFLVYWTILAIGAGVHAFLRNREQERRAGALELRQARLEGELARTQVESLKSQLHPHFLFNALHSVGGLVRAGDDAAALRTLSSLGELLRQTLDQGDSQEVALADELAVAERYLEIERIRLGDRLQSAVEVDPVLLQARVPALALLPLVENAVRHGVAPREEGGRIELRVARAGEQLLLEVVDDGPGFPADVLRGGSDSGSGDDARRHIGLENTRERLRMLYGAEQSLELENPATGGARVRIRLPLATFEEDGRG